MQILLNTVAGISHTFKFCNLLVSTSERQSMVCAPVGRDNSRALARELSAVQAHKPCSISLVP